MHDHLNCYDLGHMHGYSQDGRWLRLIAITTSTIMALCLASLAVTPTMTQVSPRFFSLLSEPCLATVLVLNGRCNVLRLGEHTNVRINGTIYLYVYNDEAQ